MTVIGEAEFYVGFGATDVLFDWSCVVGCYGSLVDNAVTSTVTIVRERAGVSAVAPFGGAGLGFAVEDRLVM